jgi:NAD(P)H-hydrate epimerase
VKPPSTSLPVWSNPDAIPWVSREQMAEVDRLATETHSIRLALLMENAGRALARLAVMRFGSKLQEGQAVVLAGKGGNGGGALVAARRLHGWGVKVQVLLRHPPDSYLGIPRQQLEILQRLDIPIGEAAPRMQTSTIGLLIDGLIGYGLRGTPDARTANLISWASALPADVRSLDLPSGLDANLGFAFDPTIKASATLTLALPKIGMRRPESASWIGELYLADIGIPPEVYLPMGLRVPQLFRSSELLQIEMER